MATEIASAYVSLSANTEQLARDTGRAFGQVEDQAEQSGKKAGGKFAGQFSKLLGAAAGGGIVGAAAGLFSLGSKFDDLSDTIQTATGKSGKALDDLNATAKNVAKNVPESLDQVGEAVANVSTKLGLTGEPLQNLATQFLNLSHITGGDLQTNISDVSRAFGDWGVQVQDQSTVLDYFYKVSTQTGVGVDKLSENVVQFGAPLRGMGFDLQTATSLLGLFQKSGVNTELVMGSMRIALANFAKDGKDAPTALRDFIQQIKDMPSSTAAAAKAMELFGQRAGADMADTIRGGKFDIDELMKSISDSGVTINGAAADTADFTEAWDNFKNKAMIELEPVATKVFGLLSDGMKWIDEHGIPTIKSFGEWVGDNKGKLEILGGAITAVLVPALITMGVAWTTAKVQAVGSAAAQVAASYSTIAGWVASAAAATASGAETAAIWLMLKADAIAGAAATVGANATAAGSWIMSKLAIAGATAVTIAHGIATKAVAAATVVWTGIQWALNAAMSANPIGLIVLAIAALAAGIIYAYQHSETFRNIVQAVWAGIKVAISAAWNFIKPIWDGFVDGLQWIGDKANWLWDHVISPVFSFIGDHIGVVWTIIKGYFEAWKIYIGILGDIIGWLWHTIIQPAWDGISTAIQFAWEHVISPAFDAFKAGIKSVGDFFGNIVAGIKTAWEGIKSAVAAPINFVINTVWNNGLLKAWNTVAGWLPGLHKADPLTPVAFAKGGAVPWWAGQNGKDSVPAMLMPDEHVLDTGDVSALGGQRDVYLMRQMLDMGIPFNWQPGKGVQNGSLPGFKDGGAVRPAWEYQLEAGHEYAKSKDHEAYTWGVLDCSGYMSAIASKILGGPGVRQWATSSFPGNQPWSPGLGQGFSVGVWDNPGGPGGGHTAGTLSGVGNYGTVNVESGGDHGDVRYGGPAAGADAALWDGKKPGRFHLSIGADGAFVSAGGPSGTEQEGFLARKLRETLDHFLNPVKAQLPHPPPEYMGWPGYALQGTEDMAIKTADGVIHGLGGGLRTAYESAKNAVGSVVGGITSVFRDNGGFLPNGLTLVRNETGQPEAVLNWEQLQQVKELMHTGKSVADSIHQVGGDTNPDHFGNANREIRTDASPGDVETMAWGQKMQNVTQKAGETFFKKVTEDILPNALFEIFTPSSKLPNPKNLIDRYTIKDSDASSASTSQTNQQSTDVTATDSGSGTTTLTDTSSKVNTDQTQLAGNDYVGWIAKAAKDHSLGVDAATIATGTALVESGMKMYANSNVPASLNFPHDAVGSDHDSVGLFQQRQSWGSLKVLMDAYGSAGLFFDKLTTFDWKSMSQGDAAQKVQVSAYPDRYQARMAEAGQLLKGKFDQGGMIPPGLSLMNNQTRAYEPAAVFNPAQWDTLSSLATGDGGQVDNRVVIQNMHVGDWHEAQRGLKQVETRQSMRSRGRSR